MTNNKYDRWEDMFKDRRDISMQPYDRAHCRRGKNFSKVESMPWWLKVNYVSQHLHSVGGNLKAGE